MNNCCPKLLSWGSKFIRVWNSEIIKDTESEAFIINSDKTEREREREREREGERVQREKEWKGVDIVCTKEGIRKWN